MKDLKHNKLLVPRLTLHEAYQFLVLTRQTKTKATSKIKIYSKYDMSGRLQNDSSGGPKIKIENVSKELEVDKPKKPGNEDSALQKKVTNAKLNESRDKEGGEGVKVRNMMNSRGGTGKKTSTRKASQENRRNGRKKAEI